MDNKARNCDLKKDLRIKKTFKALHDAMFAMLGRRNFNDITINELCADALVSRASFYAHFNDKYDLLKYLLEEIKKSIVKDVYQYDELARDVNQFVSHNKKLIANVVRDANNETLTILRGFFSAILDLAIKRKVNDDASITRVILVNFFVGGLVNQLVWMVDNGFPPEICLMNPYLYKMLESLTDWDAENDRLEAAAKKL